MKPMQIVLLLALVVAIIFGVTFASMYVSRPPDTPSKKRPADVPVNPTLHLNFEQPIFPYANARPTDRIVTEYGQMGHHDFWFENANDEEMRLGLSKLSCKCAEAKVCIAPKEWRAPLAQAVATSVGVGSQPLGWVPMGAAVVQKRTDLAESAEGLETLKVGPPGVAVPPRSSGFLRLEWEAKRGVRAGPRTEMFGVEIWWQSPSAGGATLEANALLAEGVWLDVDDLSTGTLGPNGLAERTVLLWSATRRQFAVAEVVSSAPDFVTCSQPEPMTDEDRQELLRRGVGVWIREKLERYSIDPRSGYRLRITVREQKPDGSRFDEGLFLHHIRIKPREKIILPDPLEVAVRGAVRGDVSLVGAEHGINLDQFAVSQGIRRQIALQIERKDLSLKVDRAPGFMKVRLSEPEPDARGRRTWKLTLEIAPNTVAGAFPRRDSEEYRDSAIYLKIEGAVNRRLRIPVTGHATQ